MSRFIQYIKDTRGELKHVSWPTQKQSIFFTVLIIILSLFTAFFLGFFDFIFTRALDIFFLDGVSIPVEQVDNEASGQLELPISPELDVTTEPAPETIFSPEIPVENQ